MATIKPLHQFLFVSLVGVLLVGAQARPGFHSRPYRSKAFFVSVSYWVSSSKDTSQSMESLRRLGIAVRSFRLLDDPKLFLGHGDEIQNVGLHREAVFFPTVQLLKEQQFVVPENRHAIDMTKVPFDASTSLRDRAMDILSVVISLLFGAGCGALVACTMYLAWSLINNGCDVDVHEDELPDHEEYVKIPTEPELVKTKEGYEGN